MIAHKIISNKDFASKLFLKENFDRFLLTEGTLRVPYSVSINGNYHAEEGERCVTWGELRPVCTAFIKGQALPKSLHLVLKLSDENLSRTVKTIDPDIPEGAVSGLFFNIRYDDNTFTLTNGASFSDIRYMREVNEAWDRMTVRFLSNNSIESEAL